MQTDVTPYQNSQDSLRLSIKMNPSVDPKPTSPNASISAHATMAEAQSNRRRLKKAGTAILEGFGNSFLLYVGVS